MPLIDLIQIRGGTSTEWFDANPVLSLHEPGLESDTRRLKAGDGVTAWNDLQYIGGTGSGGGGIEYYETEAALIAAHPTGNPGDKYLVGTDPITLWTWDQTNTEYVNTGNEFNFGVDNEFIPGSYAPVASQAIQEALSNKMNVGGPVEMSQVTGLLEELLSKLEAADIYNINSAMFKQGTGIVLTKDGEFITVSRSGGDGESGDWGSIGGNIEDQTDLKNTYSKIPVWTPVTPSAGTVTLPSVNGTNDYYEWTESGPDTLAHSGTFKDAGYKWGRVTLSSSSYTITLGAGYINPDGSAKTSIVLEGSPGQVREFQLVRKGSVWIVYESAEATEEGTTDYEELTNKPSINGVELTGDVDPADLGISYNDLEDLPTDDEYIEYADLAAFPVTGTSDVLYAAIDTGFLYRWTGSVYTNVGGVTVPDASDTTKGKVELGDQTESEAAATATASSGADHTKASTLRGLFWFWAKKISNWAFASLGSFSSSMTWDWQGRFHSNKTVTVTSTTMTITLSNVVDGGEGNLIFTLSGVTSLTVTLAGSGLTFKRINPDETTTTITQLFFSGGSGSVIFAPCIVSGTTVYFVTSAGYAVNSVPSGGGSSVNYYSEALSKSEDGLRAKLGGESKGANQTLQTNDAFDFIIGANGVEKGRAQNGGGWRSKGTTGTAAAHTTVDSSDNILQQVLSNGNITHGGAGSYGGGVKVQFIPNATTEPTSNPTGGGIFYVFGGALKYRGSSGTVTTIGPA